MKKQLSIIFNIVIPTAIGLATFFLLYYLYQKLFFNYRWLAAIPFAIVTGYMIVENRREWKMLTKQG
jgi:hypothetical protein